MSQSYEEFVEKFKPKRTTDDCYTPPGIYDAVRAWACERYRINSDNIIRPFWPGGDYTAVNYPDDCVVLDNPPFSILSKIIRYYLEHNIKFFLFCPTLTCLHAVKNSGVCVIICDCSIIYENGEKVKTSFVTNLEPGLSCMTAPDLTEIINEEVSRAHPSRKLPRYQYPDSLLTAAMLQELAGAGVDFSVPTGTYIYVSRLDAQIPYKKWIFGDGLLLSEKVTAEKVAAEKVIERNFIAFELSEREKRIIRQLGA